MTASEEILRVRAHALGVKAEDENTRLLAACDRLLTTEREVSEMPSEQREWFFSKPGHADCFFVARGLTRLLNDPRTTATAAMRSERDKWKRWFCGLALLAGTVIAFMGMALWAK